MRNLSNDHGTKMGSCTHTTGIRLEIITRSPDETRQLGEIIGTLVPAGTIVALFGDLGSGKTIFVQGFARGLGVPEDYYITSPSYTLINEYPARHTFFHVDLYRIESPIDFDDIGLQEVLNGKGVVAIEWAVRLGRDLPVEHLNMRLEIKGDHSRKISITAYGLALTNLLKKLENQKMFQAFNQ